jgi:hypothetical protein
LFLPAAGDRGDGNGTLNNRGSLGSYWSSTESGSNAFFLGFGNGYAYTSLSSRTAGLSVRCVAE